tara:strand:- start:3646 stop:6225 length:2580 start_codon:yes stop_codon:yes gene_type:complete
MAIFIGSAILLKAAAIAAKAGAVAAKAGAVLGKGAAVVGKGAAAGGKALGGAAKVAGKKTISAAKVRGKKALGSVKGRAKKIAKDKLLGRDKKKGRKFQRPQQEGAEQQQEKGGELAVRPTATLAPTGPGSVGALGAGGALASIDSDSDSGSSGGGSEQEIANNISKKLIKVDKLLAGSLAIKEQKVKDLHKIKEDESDKKQESALEKVKPKEGEGGKFKMKVPGKGILSKIFGFFGSVILGWIAFRLVDWMPKLMPVLKGLAAAADWMIDAGGKVLNFLATFIEFGYKLYDAATGWIKNALGEEGAKKFDIFMNNLKNLINGFLVWKIIGEKIFKAIVSSIKNTWKIIKGAFKTAFKLAKVALKAAWNLVKNLPGVRQGAQWLGRQAGRAGGFLKNLVGMGGKGAGQVAGKVTGLMAKFLGPASKALGPIMKAVGPGIKKFASRIPILGPIIVAVVSIMSGESLGQALFKGIGAALGGALGATLAAALTTATVGLGSLVAPAMTMLGELIGTFVGDLLYEGFMGDGWGAALDKLKGAVGGIFKAALNVGGAVINFFKDGFGRLIENFPTVNIPDFRPGDIIANILMKMPGGLDILGLEVPKWVPGIGGLSVIGGLQGLPGLQEILGFFAQFIPGMGKYIQGGRLLAIPNLLYLTPGPGLALLAPTIAKSFMPGTFGEPTAPSIPSEAPAAPKKVSAASIRAESEKRKKEAAEKALAAMKEKIGGAVDWVKGGLSKLNPFGGKDKDKETEKEPKTSMLTGGMVGKNLAANLHKGEIVIDPDSAGPARDMLLAINQASTYEGIVEAIRAFAPYEALETPPTPTSTPGSISTPSEGGSSELVIVGGGAKGEDPFEALDFFG